MECGEIRCDLHVHHTKYFKNKLPWETNNNYLITLCKRCHYNKHNKNIKKEGFVCVGKLIKPWMNDFKKTNTIKV